MTKIVLEEVFRTGEKGRRYVKTRDAAAILRGQDLAIAVEACVELKAFLNTILRCAGGTVL
jgi:hypothetical protein